MPYSIDEKPEGGFSELFVEEMTEGFRETGNPLLAWEIFFTARRFNVPVPAEVFAYLDAVAFQMMKIGRKPPAPKARAAAVAKALGMGKDTAGAGSPFTDTRLSDRDRRIAMEVFTQIQEGKKEYIAIEDMSEARKLSESTVRRIYKRHLARWESEADKLRGQGFCDGQKHQLYASGTADDFREMSIIIKIAKNPSP